MSNSILIIEDTSSILLVYQSVLQRAGFRVSACGTGAEGRTKFEDEKFDLVIVDLSLPDYDGLELLKEILMLSPNTPCIVVTANGSMNKAVEAMRLGSYDFLVKPIADERLVETAKAALGSGQGSASRYRVGTGPNSPCPNQRAVYHINQLVGYPLAELEKGVIEATISKCGGSLPKAAEILGLAPSTLYRKRQNWDK